MFLGGWKGHCHRAAVQEGAAVTGRGCHNHRHRLHTLQSSPLDSSSATEELLNKRRRRRRRKEEKDKQKLHSSMRDPSSTYRGTIASRSISLANNIHYSIHSGGCTNICWLLLRVQPPWRSRPTRSQKTNQAANRIVPEIQRPNLRVIHHYVHCKPWRQLFTWFCKSYNLLLADWDPPTHQQPH